MNPGDQMTVTGLVHADRKWWQFWKKRNPLAGQPIVFTVVAESSSGPEKRYTGA